MVVRVDSDLDLVSGMPCGVSGEKNNVCQLCGTCHFICFVSVLWNT